MQKRISPNGVAALLEQVSRLIHSTGYAEGLYPAQWTALRFFSEAPASARTTAGLARFQGMSLGPVARTVRTLVEKGMLARAANPLSRRADLIAVTSLGRSLLQKDPRLEISKTIETLPPKQQEALASALETLLYGLFSLQRPAGEMASALDLAEAEAAEADAVETKTNDPQEAEKQTPNKNGPSNGS